jgi:CrcB protein
MLGGALGAAGRAALVWPFQTEGGPVAASGITAVVNIVGALALGIVVGALGTRHPSARAFLGTGILGGFTTYSAFAVQLATLPAVAPAWALLIALVTLVVGFLAAGLGLRAGRALGGRGGAADAPEEAE